MEHEKLTASVSEVAQMLGVGTGLVYELVRTKKIPSIKLGNRILIPRNCVSEMVDNALKLQNPAA